MNRIKKFALRLIRLDLIRYCYEDTLSPVPWLVTSYMACYQSSVGGGVLLQVSHVFTSVAIKKYNYCEEIKIVVITSTTWHL